VRLEGFDRLKNPTTSSGIEPTTFRLPRHYFNKSYIFFEDFSRTQFLDLYEVVLGSPKPRSLYAIHVVITN
jgi:hypothetical protein